MKFFNFKELDKEQTEFYYKIFRNAAFVVFIFAVIVSIVLTLNYVSMKLNDPVNLPVLQEMIQQAHQNRENEVLAESVRELDLMARKAHFTSEAFRQFGAYLLIGSLLALFVLLKILSELKKKDPDPGKYTERQDNPGIAKKIRYGIIILAGLIFLTALTLPFIFPSDLDMYLSEMKKKESTDQTAVKYASADEMKQNWPGFRGYYSLGISYAINVPTVWDGASGRNIKWKTGIPRSGFSSPVVWSNRIFLTGGDNDARTVYCFDSETGDTLWVYDITASNSEIPKTTEDTGLAAPGMCTDGNYIFAIFATGELVCLGFEGNKIWEKKLPVPKNHYGHSSSLITYKNLLLVQYDHADGAKVMAFNSADGKIKWENKRDVETAWPSPVIIPGEKPQLLLAAVPLVISYNPESGKEYWKMEDVVSGELGSSPAYADDTLFIANQFSRLAAVNLKEQKIIWEHEDDLPDAASLAAFNNLVFVPTSYGFITCLNAKDGSVQWTHKFDEGFYGSPVIAEGKVFIVDRQGITRIFKAENTLQLINSPALGEPSTCTPAILNNRIYIRGKKNLYCIGN